MLPICGEAVVAEAAVETCTLAVVIVKLLRFNALPEINLVILLGNVDIDAALLLILPILMFFTLLLLLLLIELTDVLFKLRLTLADVPKTFRLTPFSLAKHCDKLFTLDVDETETGNLAISSVDPTTVLLPILLLTLALSNAVDTIMLRLLRLGVDCKLFAAFAVEIPRDKFDLTIKLVDAVKLGWQFLLLFVVVFTAVNEMLGERSLNCFEIRVAPGGLVVGIIIISFVDDVADVTMGTKPNPPPSPIVLLTLFDAVVLTIPNGFIFSPLPVVPVTCLLLLLLLIAAVVVSIEALGLILIVFDRPDKYEYGDDDATVTVVDEAGVIEIPGKVTKGRVSVAVILEVVENTVETVVPLLEKDIGCKVVEDEGQEKCVFVGVFVVVVRVC